MIDVSHIKIAVVDDEEVIRLNLAVFLEDEGFFVDEYESAEALLTNLSSKSYDCIVVDLRLPGIDGEELIERVNQYDGECKFVIHTGSTEFILSPALRDCGLDSRSILHKPVTDMSRISRLILQCLEMDCEC